MPDLKSVPQADRHDGAALSYSLSVQYICVTLSVFMSYIFSFALSPQFGRSLPLSYIHPPLKKTYPPTEISPSIPDTP